MDLENLKQKSNMNVEQLLKTLETSYDGLNTKQVLQNFKKYGYNSISSGKEQNILIKFISKFLNPLILMLFSIVIISFLINEKEAAAIILLMIIINVLLTFFQENKADKAAEELKKLVSTTVTVVREGQEKIIVQKGIMPGDIVKLSAGNIVPADVRIISSKNLYVDQSAVTGEVLPVEKRAILHQELENNYESSKNYIFDIPNICFMGTNVSSGTAIGVVIATGNNTYLSSIAEKILQNHEESSFQKGIDSFVMLMIKVMSATVLIIFVMNALTNGNWIEALLFAIAVAVGLAPEMMPMIVTINLSKGAINLSKGKVIIKKLNSIQNLGAMDVLCSDKTGTLTQNKVILEKHIDINREENEDVFVNAYLNSYFQTGLKNLMDKSILEHAKDYLEIIPKYSKIDELPFDFRRKRMSVIVKQENTNPTLICKGAIREIVSICSHINDNNNIISIDEKYLEKINKITQELNEDGFRVLAVAYKNFESQKSSFSYKDENNLVLMGFAAFLDPPKETAEKAVNQLYEKGVDIKILTGDNEVITKKICNEVGIEIKGIILGNDIENLPDEELSEIIENNNIFAKLNPEHKERIVKILKNNNHVTGFLGDGINDALALKAADVGISVDTAADIAKESADIILLEKSLLILEKGIVEGRKVFGNITRYLKASSGSNFGNMISLTTATIFLPFLPLAPVQIIAKNLIYDISQMATLSDNTEREYTKKPKSWNIKNIKKSMIVLGLVNVVFDYITFAVLIRGFGALENKALFQTGWFVKALIAEILVIYAIRTDKMPFIKNRASIPVFLMNALITSLILLFLQSPFALYMGFVKLPDLYYLFLVFILLVYLIFTGYINKKYLKTA